MSADDCAGLEEMRGEYRQYAERSWARINEIGAEQRKQSHRTVWTLVALAVVLTGIGVWQAVLQHSQDSTLTEVQHGRQLSLGVTCAALSAVSAAGQQVIVGGAAGGESRRAERGLERLGFPPLAERRALARREAAAYVESISARVDRQVGSRGDGLIRSDGTIDCAKLKQLGHAP